MQGGGGMRDPDFQRVIACNTISDDPSYSRGSLAYVMQLAGERARVLIHSRGGRWVERWVAISQLANFRFKQVPVGSRLAERVGVACSQLFFSESDLESLSTRGAGQGLRLR
jgi:hypothetical protein